MRLSQNLNHNIFNISISFLCITFLRILYKLRIYKYINIEIMNI